MKADDGDAKKKSFTGHLLSANCGQPGEACDEDDRGVRSCRPEDSLSLLAFGLRLLCSCPAVVIFSTRGN